MTKLALAGLLLLQAQADDLPVQTLDSAVRGISGYSIPREASLIDDAAFLARLMKDVLGGTPTDAELKAFVADVNPKKRAAKIDQLVADDRFNDFWARRFFDVVLGDAEKLKFDLEDK